MLHPPSRAYIDPWTGELFGEGGVEKDLRTSKGGNKPESAHGDVIMSKLGNATAKYVLFSLFSALSFRCNVGRKTDQFFLNTGLSWDERLGSYCMSHDYPTHGL